jgi:hypothetical protein
MVVNIWREILTKPMRIFVQDIIALNAHHTFEACHDFGTYFTFYKFILYLVTVSRISVELKEDQPQASSKRFGLVFIHDYIQDRMISKDFGDVGLRDQSLNFTRDFSQKSRSPSRPQESPQRDIYHTGS